MRALLILVSINLKENIMNSVKVEIADLVTRYCEVNNVYCLFAVERSSRVWGYASQNSDYDVMFVYIRPVDDYLSIHSRDDTLCHKGCLKKDLLDTDDKEFTLTGWDLKKFLSLMLKSNPTTLELLSILYAQKEFVYYDVYKSTSTSFLYPCFEQGLNFNRYTLANSYYSTYINHINRYKIAKLSDDVKRQMKHLIAACMNLNLAEIYITNPLTRNYFMNYTSSQLEKYMISLSSHKDYYRVIDNLRKGVICDNTLLDALYLKLTYPPFTEDFNDKLSKLKSADDVLYLFDNRNKVLDNVFRNVVKGTINE